MKSVASISGALLFVFGIAAQAATWSVALDLADDNSRIVKQKGDETGTGSGGSGSGSGGGERTGGGSR